MSITGLKNACSFYGPAALDGALRSGIVVTAYSGLAYGYERYPLGDMLLMNCLTGAIAAIAYEKILKDDFNNGKFGPTYTGISRRRYTNARKLTPWVSVLGGGFAHFCGRNPYRDHVLFLALCFSALFSMAVAVSHHSSFTNFVNRSG